VLGDGIVNRCYSDSPQKGCPHRTVIANNIASHNTASGIDNAASQGATIVNNVALFNNTDYTDTFVSKVNIPGPYLDLVDYNPDCDDNTWLDNTFRTFDPPCVKHHVGATSTGSGHHEGLPADRVTVAVTAHGRRQCDRCDGRGRGA
jgi:hypothetical protein